VPALDAAGAVKIGERAGDADDAGIGPGRQVEGLGGASQQRRALGGGSSEVGIGTASCSNGTKKTDAFSTL